MVVSRWMVDVDVQYCEGARKSRASSVAGLLLLPPNQQLPPGHKPPSPATQHSYVA